jgi:adenylylsulfate reductase, subunit B
MCWECFPCVKACPQKAIEVRSYSDFAPLGGRVTCDRDEKTNLITWHIKYRNGRRYDFTFPIRTTPWGSIRSPALYPAPDGEALKSPLLVGEPAVFGLMELPRPGRAPQRA